MRGLGIAAIAGVAALGCAYLIGGRYSLGVMEGALVRLDRITGEATVCGGSGSKAGCRVILAPGPGPRTWRLAG